MAAAPAATEGPQATTVYVPRARLGARFVSIRPSRSSCAPAFAYNNVGQRNSVGATSPRGSQSDVGTALSPTFGSDPQRDDSESSKEEPDPPITQSTGHNRPGRSPLNQRFPTGTVGPLRMGGASSPAPAGPGDRDTNANLCKGISPWETATATK